jgi:type II secretory pathway component PulF
MSELDATIVAAAEAMERRPGMPARLLGALPMFLVFVIFALYMLLCPRFGQMFKEMDLGALPWITTCVLEVGYVGHDYYFLFCPGMFAIAWVYFTWGCATGRRMMRVACAMGMLAFLMFVFGVVAYVIPLTRIMDTIGK